MVVEWKLKERKRVRDTGTDIIFYFATCYRDSMRKINLFIASSLEGYIAREDNSIDWLYMDGDYGYTQFYDSVDTILMDRRTYYKVLEFGAGYPHKDEKNLCSLKSL
jgi:hypothetical protein